MKKILFDCDNTFGVKGCDVDDGLALLYLLGDPKAGLLGVTTTYGNNRIEVVHPNTMAMMQTIGHPGIPVIKGGAHAGDYDSPGARFLAREAAAHAGDVAVLATGSLTNLYGAYKQDSHFFEYVSEIVLMGGITEPLQFAKKVMNELNFSCDPLASFTTLTLGQNVSIATGNNCLKVLFTRDEDRSNLAGEQEIARYIRETTDYWFDDNRIDYGIGGFYNWDVTAAAYLMHPELFADEQYHFQISEEDLKQGFLRRGEGEGNTNCTLNLPVIGSPQAFKQNIYETWLKVRM